MIQAMARELHLQQTYLKHEAVKTIYLGGGTPSLLDISELATLMETVHKNYRVSKSAEITLEANPDDLTPQKLSNLKELGINRLSIGIQSFNDGVLQFLHRAHDTEAALKCMQYARQAGFENISIDLIYAIPNQTREAWVSNIKQALALKPEHISSYSLTIEDKTVFGNWRTKGKLKPVEDDEAAVQLEILVEALEANGFEQYEVSNFAQPGFQSQHNSSYWKQDPYLGIGPSAHSYNGISRQYNLSNNAVYLKSLKEDKIPFTREELSFQDKINDYLLTTLRTSWGADLKKLENDYNYPILQYQKTYIEALCTRGLAILKNNNLVLTKAGKLLADKISSDLFVIK